MKKQNYRAHKKALKTSRRKSNRNIEVKRAKQIEREHEESFSHQLNLFLENIEDRLTATKRTINIEIAKLKFAWHNRRIFKSASTDFYDLTNYFATRENISLVLAASILLNCFVTAGFIIEDDESKKTIPALYGLQNVLEIPKQKVDVPKNIEGLVTVSIKGEELTYEDIFEIVKYRYGVNDYELLWVIAVCLLEAGENMYDGCFDVASVFINRITDISCINFVNGRYAPGTGTNIYAQAVCPAQFTVSKTKIKQLINDGMTQYKGYYAVLDCLYSGIPSHNYTRFVAPHLKQSYMVQLSPRGDYFFSVSKSENKIPLEEVLPNFDSLPDRELLQGNEEAKSLNLKPKTTND